MPETLDFKEVMRPTHTPELGFQSYEMMGGDPTERRFQQEAFLSGAIRNPKFDYPHLDKQALETGIRNLDKILKSTKDIEDEEVAAAIWDSTSYRMAEMYWLLSAKRLNELADNPTSEAFKTVAENFQTLNEELYGKPDPELTKKVYGEILGQGNEKRLHPSAQVILDELKHGGSVFVEGQTVHFDGIESRADGRLPDLTGRLKYLKEFLIDEFSDVIEIVNDYWHEVCVPRAGAESGQEPAFYVDDMVEIFKRVHAGRDPNNESGISIVKNPHGTSLAWDTPSMSVRVGAGRDEARGPITSVWEMIAKTIHEYGTHGGRTINGNKTELPILATGMFTDAEEGEQADYLTFEEAIAVLGETALEGDEFKGWKPVHVSRYLADASAYEGCDLRQAFEINWRTHLVMNIKSGQEVTPDMVDNAKKQAYVAVGRIYRSTPTELSAEVRPLLTFNKDLAYLKGRMIALRFLDQIGDDKQMLKFVFSGKFDPTNRRQLALAKKFIPKP